MVALGIITPISEPTDWVHPLVVMANTSGALSLTIDLSKLNKFVKRPVYFLLSPKDVVCDISPTSRYFGKLDAAHSYWKIPLDEASQLLTVFATPLGRFKCLRGVSGLCSTGE